SLAITMPPDSAFLSSRSHVSLRSLFTVPPTTDIYTLSLHDALPILMISLSLAIKRLPTIYTISGLLNNSPIPTKVISLSPTKSRSEEHTSELQSRENLVCRLLLEKKKIQL